MHRIFMLLLLFLMPGYTVAADQPPKVKVGIMSSPGYAQLDEDGQPAGKTVTLSRKLITEAGYEPQFQLLPTARIWQGLKSGQIDIWPGMLSKPGMREHALLTERDLGQVGINLYYRPDTQMPVWPDGLRGKNLITITNYTYTAALQQVLADPELGVHISRSASHTGAVEMLLRGRGDYLLGYRSQVGSVLQQRGMQPLPYIEVATQPMRFLLSRHAPRAQQLRDDLDAAYDRLKAAGHELDVNRQ